MPEENLIGISETIPERIFKGHPCGEESIEIFGGIPAEIFVVLGAISEIQKKKP